MQHVGEDQFLVLLLVVQAERDQGLHGPPARFIAVADEVLHGRIHMRAIGMDLGQGRPGQQPALRPRMARAQGFVVGVEKIKKKFVERLIVRGVGLQNQGLEKQAGMRQVPFGGAGIGHGLDALVLGRQRRRQRHAMGPDVRIPLRQGFAPGLDLGRRPSGRRKRGHAESLQ